MIRSINLTNFRSHAKFQVQKLGMVNLLVGTNNSGKTSILEAIELLLAHGDPRNIWNALSRRGERILDEEERRGGSEIDICRLFHGHSLELDSSFEIRAICDGHDQVLRAQIKEADPLQDELLPMDQDSLFSANALKLQWQGNTQEEGTTIALTDRGGVTSDAIRRRPMRKEESRDPVAFVSTSSLGADEVSILLSRVILNPEENLLLNALRIIDPSIERLAPVSSIRVGYPGGSRGGVVIKCTGVDKRLPIGTMGDGIWRLLALSLSLVKASGGVLLVDEIDTGLHYTVMEKMWRLVFETASRLKVQVFATTHSSDCWRALASISRVEVADQSEVTIQRIEGQNSAAVQFSEREIVMAADSNIEVR